ncbi:I78 family peptidase inhibitor [uncultured Pseudomonas sp.]|uniref:I78 family peptidase inhibitor n=1 Tax=uncultured Pseudomonas sp. TaxID=114707 RepID=UPI0025F5CCC5|nr:I78 family peptidase inhibitor [uncultured Pseudomonas sp.]
MSFKTPLLLAGAAFFTLLAGCSSQATQDTPAAATSPATSGAASSSGRCNSDLVQDLVGKALTPALAEESRQRAGAQVVRVVRPQDPMTMDFNSQRLSITTSATLVVQTATCG